MTITNRENYGLLDWLGDLGGLFDALYLICRFFVAPVAAFNMQAVLMTNFFRERPSDLSMKAQDTLGTNDSYFKKYFSKDMGAKAETDFL